MSDVRTSSDYRGLSVHTGQGRGDQRPYAHEGITPSSGTLDVLVLAAVGSKSEKLHRYRALIGVSDCCL
jgi:hypothetical protein